MPSTNKTPHMGLNSWLATDSPRRVDFNADNVTVDAAVARIDSELGGVRKQMESNAYNISSILLQRSLEGRTDQKRAIIMDSFVNENLVEPSSTEAAVVSVAKRPYLLNSPNMFFNPTYQTSVTLGSTETNREVCQSFTLTETCRLSEIAIPVYMMYSSIQCTVAIYTADSVTSPSRTAKFSRVADVTGDQSGWRIWLTDINVTLAPGQYYLSVAHKSGYFSWYCKTGNTDGEAVYQQRWSGGQWLAPVTNIKMNFLLGLIPSRKINYTTKEIALVEPCSTAVTYIRRTSGAQDAVVPYISVTGGGAPSFIRMTRSPEKCLTVADGEIEECYEASFPAGDRVAVRLETDGAGGPCRVYSFGCILN